MFDDKDLSAAKDTGILSEDQYLKLIEFLNSRKLQSVGTNKKFTLENFLYYFGTLLIMVAMGWYLHIVWDKFGSAGVLILSVCYAVIFSVVANILWKKGKQTAGGLLYTCVVAFVPLAVWALEILAGFEPDESSRLGWIIMELSTIIAGLIMLKFRKFPFFTFPICYALWLLSMDTAPLLFGKFDEPTWVQRNFTSVIYSVIMLGVALKFDRKTMADFSGWFYIFGALMLWISSIFLLSNYHLFNKEWVFALFALGNFIFMVISILLQRKVFMVLGALGIIAYLVHLIYTLFKNSAMLPVVLVILGLIIIFTGVLYAKNCNVIEEKLRNLLLGKFQS